MSKNANSPLKKYLCITIFFDYHWSKKVIFNSTLRLKGKCVKVSRLRAVRKIRQLITMLATVIILYSVTKPIVIAWESCLLGIILISALRMSSLHIHCTSTREPLLERTFCRINTQQHEEWWFVFAWWPLLVVEPSRYMRFAKNKAYILQSAIFNIQSDKLTVGRWGQSGLWWTRETRRRKNHTQMEIIHKLQDKMEKKIIPFFSVEDPDPDLPGSTSLRGSG